MSMKMSKLTRNIIFSLIVLCISLISYAQDSRIVEDFKPTCKALSKAILKRTTVKSPLKLKNVMMRSNYLDFYFTTSLGDCPWHKEDVEWFRDTLKQILPHKYKSYEIGDIYSLTIPLDSITVPKLGFRGKPNEVARTADKPYGMVIVKKEGEMKYNRGLQDRHIAIWQSHGRYFDYYSEMWYWQRPNMFNICEDLFTQSFVLPYLVPMLENAGAYVMLPRERDIQINESIADNDNVFSGSHTTAGNYQETGSWDDAGNGFGHREFYYGEENPFQIGTARKTHCIAFESKKAPSTIIWKADIPQRGEYAVYVSYKTVQGSVSAARYTVHHLGGESSFIVNQRMGGSTWIYLGTFEFAKGSEGYVELDNRTPEGYRHDPSGIITADAVRFGGGMGNITRGRKFDPQNDTIPHYAPSVSGLPRSMEAARYWLQWAGVPTSVYSQNDGTNDYKDDYMSRGDWVAWMSGGSAINLKKSGKRIPFDLAFGFHSDAGVTTDSTVIGTLAIYTYKSKEDTEFETGDSRMTSRELASLVQDQIVNDLRTHHDSDWNRRCVWDRSYRESRTPTCPSMLLELLSHQNFNDMKFGLDPTFRFTTSRAIYKGMLKYLANRYGQSYVVQPLPVEEVSASFLADSLSQDLSKVTLSWNRTDDQIEPTAVAEGYILQTKIDDGAFDNGQKIETTEFKDGRFSTTLEIKPGHVYSYRIIAYNKGGKSFPAHTVSIGVPEKIDTSKYFKRILLVNNFDRVSGPAFFENGDYAGFLTDKESGVPMGKEIAFTGKMYDFDKKSDYLTNPHPGFGASYSDNFGKVIAGNTFDYTTLHGKAILAVGHPFSSCSRDIFCNDSTFRDSFWATDLICGKQLTTVMPDGTERFKVFTIEIQEAIRDFTSKGGNMLVSGAYIATDIWSKVYPTQTDTTYRKATIEFAEKTLGYKFNCSHGSRNGSLQMTSGGALKWTDINGHKYIYSAPNPDFYFVEHPNGIAPSSKSAKTIVRYGDTGAPAGIAFKGGNYSTVCYGFPLETLKKEEDLIAIIEASLEFMTR